MYDQGIGADLQLLQQGRKIIDMILQAIGVILRLIRETAAQMINGNHPMRL